VGPLFPPKEAAPAPAAAPMQRWFNVTETGSRRN
jgi:hypothetical protein